MLDIKDERFVSQAKAPQKYIPLAPSHGSRSLTTPLGDRPFLSRRFADRTGRRPISAAKCLGSQHAAPTDRGHPKGRSAAKDPS
jgi:hypothetical protein